MKLLKLNVENRKFVKVVLTLVSITLIFILPSLFSSVNQNLQKVFREINSVTYPDSNIILLHINSNDIENLSGWPLKRSYYALLIKNLTNLNVKKIGLEIFLSENISSQNIYNEVLDNSIRESGKVVLSSIAENLVFNNGTAISQNILFPNPKKSINHLKTGHINFSMNDGILIPDVIINKGFTESSFSSKLFDQQISNTNLKVNFISSWKSFQNYSLLDFFRMIETNDQRLKGFAGKYIIVGVSDLLIAKTIESDYDSDLPGIGLHAFALDNLINNRSINYNFYNLSKYLFSISALILCFFSIRTRVYISVLFISFLTFSVLWNYSYLQLYYSAFLLPIFLVIIGNFALKIFDRNKLFDLSITESEELKKELTQKENELEKITYNLKEQSQKPSQNLLTHIKDLKNEIAKLKQVESEDAELFASNEKAQNFEGLIFRSKKMTKITQLIKKVAPENAGILIMGESGSGKELVANAIHNLSKRNKENFVVVNCAALPDNLLESELFGHVKGAFTDAIKDKIGRFEEADNGTLFLDEIGETSEKFQVKLLRVLQSGDFQKVGSSTTQKVDVRIVAATNKNLHKLVKEQKFREDLYYRLNIINIELPTLNERSEDIEVLAEYFVNKEVNDFSFSKAVMKKLVEHTWKGNIRELESTIKRAVIFAKTDNRKIIKLKDLPDNLAKVDKNDLENMILESLREKKFSHSSINETAKELGDLNRTIITENYRGLFFRTYIQNNFELEKTIELIADTEDETTIEKVRTKTLTYLKNIDKDLNNHKDKSFEEIKALFISKYKNLPQKYHKYLDKVIQNKMSQL